MIKQIKSRQILVILINSLKQQYFALFLTTSKKVYEKILQNEKTEGLSFVF